MRLALLAALGLLATPSADAQRLAYDERLWLVVRELPPLFDDERVWREATSGLTATLVIWCERERGSPVEAGRIELRWEPWEEQLQVVVSQPDGPSSAFLFTERSEVATWWRELEIPLAPGTLVTRPRGKPVTVAIDLLPFSRQEQEATRRWVADVSSRGEASSRTDASSEVESGSDTLGRVFGLLLATSIESRAVASWNWALELPASSRSKEGK